MIKMENLKDRWVYKIRARNAHVGVWIEEKNGFLIPREKFEALYLFIEYHYDFDPTIGTAKPYEEIGPCPIGIMLGVNTWHTDMDL